MANDVAPAAGSPAAGPPFAVAEPTAASSGATTAPAPAEPRDTLSRSVWLRWLLPVHPVQVCVWQACAIATIVASASARVIVGVLAAVIVLASAVRVRGLTGFGWLAAWTSLSVRRHRFRGRPASDPLSAVLPGLTITDNIDRAGNRTGVAHVRDGWSALVRVLPYGPSDIGTLLTALDAAMARTDIPVHAAQLVVRTAVGPTGEPVRVYWLAVQYLPAEAPAACAARGGGEIGALRATSTAALLLTRDLVDAGCRATVLDGDALRHDLLVALGVNPGGGTPTIRVTESWRSWSIGSGRQACHHMFRTPTATTFTRAVPGSAFGCTSLTRRRTRTDAIATEVVVRVADRPQLQWMTSAQRPSGAYPTHGRHDRYVRRTLPLALD